VSVLETIAAQRQKLLDGIDANEGDINLRIFEDFYPDEAHFIYELLQNAEDAGATEVRFELTEHACFFEHNGSRHFNEGDIRGITGIFNSSKKDNPDKIGKFGVGFKSVFVYTDTPFIYSKDYSFKIIKLVLPQPIKPKKELGDKTRFEFPFNNPKKNVKAAFSEVKAGLEQLSETTLLFLNNLRYISWRVGDKESAVLREEHSASHVEILKLSDGKEILSSHWLRFAEPVQNVEKFASPMEGVERQKVALAFALAFVGDISSFDEKKPLAKQLKIVPALRGKVAVFFPAEKETSGLRFHIHAPFIPELSRASIKNSIENVPLFEQLALVTARSLHTIKGLGLLTGEFLAVLPNNEDPLPERYAQIRKAVIDEMQVAALVPTFDMGFAPATRLLQARASMKSLLTKEELALVTARKDEPMWSIGATQRNNNLDRFLTSLGIPSLDVGDLKVFFESRAKNAIHRWDNSVIDPEVITWLKNKPAEWFQALYAVLLKYCEDQSDYGQLKNVYFVKLTDGRMGSASESYFQTGSVNAKDPHPRVEDSVFTVGTKKGQQEDAKKFLEKLGVRVPNEGDELALLLRTRYGEEGEDVDDNIYALDLARMIYFLENNPKSRSIFISANIFKVEAPEFNWARAEHVYLDAPFVQTNLKGLYDGVVDSEQKRWPLAAWYLTCGIPIEKISLFAEIVGCEKDFNNLSVKASCKDNPNWDYLQRAPGERYGNHIDRDFALSNESLALLNAKQDTSALMVWRALGRLTSTRPLQLQACYQINDRGGARYSDSQLICALKEMDWVPLMDGRFVKPSEASALEMPKGFVIDTANKWMEAVGFGIDYKKREIDNAARAVQRKQLGFLTEEELQDAQTFTKLPKAERERILKNARHLNSDPLELPEQLLRNPELRSKRVGEQAKTTPEKSTVIKPRSVPLGVEAVMLEAKLYLADQYTNGNGQMICQACREELPFKLPNGSYYFEAVEIVREASKRFPEGFLALCPNHAAAYKYANAQGNSMKDVIAAAIGNEVELSLGNIETILYFTQTHLADAKACFDSIEDNDD
jgi:hypothetical protein